jgi:protein TonB
MVEGKDFKTPKKMSTAARTVLWAFFISLLLHAVTVWKIGIWGGEARRNREISKPLTLRIRPAPEVRKTPRERSIVETRQTPTAPPVDEARLGAQDHRAEKEKTVKHIPAPKADFVQKPAPPSQNAAGKDVKRAIEPPGSQKPRPMIAVDGAGKLRVVRPGRTRNPYEALLQDQSNALTGKVAAPDRAEILDGKVEEGDRVDLNTTNYKYLSYFIGLRKSIELTWVYPSEAVRRGLQGDVRLEFKIEKDGKMSRIRILDSSGYEILDRAIVDAIKLAAPFAPLPKSMGKESLNVTATFKYLLYAYN